MRMVLPWRSMLAVTSSAVDLEEKEFWAQVKFLAPDPIVSCVI
jgi:hypothetical protein